MCSEFEMPIGLTELQKNAKKLKKKKMARASFDIVTRVKTLDSSEQRLNLISPSDRAKGIFIQREKPAP